MEAKLITEKAAVSSAEGLLRKTDKEMKMAKQALRDQYAKGETLKKKCVDIEALQSKVAALEKVN